MCEALREIWADDIERARNEGLRLGMEEGREEGMTLSVVTLLDVKDTVSTPLKEKIGKEKNIEILKSWVKLAASVSSAGSPLPFLSSMTCTAPGSVHTPFSAATNEFPSTVKSTP